MSQQPNEVPVEPDQKMYSQIIFRNPDDPELQRILSCPPKSTSPRRFKRWSPEISFEERTLRKKWREDNYIQKIYPEERPILLVKKKQKFKNLGNPNLIGSVPSEEKNFKVSRNTRLLHNVDDDIQQNRGKITRTTVVHDRPKLKSDVQQKGPEGSPTNPSIYKIEGVEYMPEGFLELDPLLLKDEYYFENKVMEKMFKEEQRKLKALRRKQYAEKNYQKKRDVTIYVIEQYKDRVIEFLDLWFEKYKRKMTKNELEEVSSRLDTSLENLSRLQDLYLKRKRLLNAKKLKEHKYSQPKDWARATEEASTPVQIREYLGKKDKFSHVKSKVKQDPLGTGRWRYTPSYIQRYNEKQSLKRPLSATYGSRNSHRKKSIGAASQKSLSRVQYQNQQLKNLNQGDNEEVNSVDNTFYLLSKTNKDGSQRNSNSNRVLSGKESKYDQLVEDFNRLLDGKEIKYEDVQNSPKTFTPQAQTPKRQTFGNQGQNMRNFEDNRGSQNVSRRVTGAQNSQNNKVLHQSDLIQREGIPNRGDRNSRVNNITSNRNSQSQRFNERRSSGQQERRRSSAGRVQQSFSKSGVTPESNIQTHQAQNIQNLNRGVSGGNQEMLRGHEIRRISQNQGGTDQAKTYAEMIQKQIVQKQGDPLKRGEFSDRKNEGQKDSNYESNLKAYFDTQIEDILDKIKACKVEPIADCEVHVDNKNPLMNCSQSLRKGDLQEQIQHQRLNDGANQNYQIDTRRETRVTQGEMSSGNQTRRTTRYTEYNEDGRGTRATTQYTQQSGHIGDNSYGDGSDITNTRRNTKYTDFDPSRRETEYTEGDIIDIEQRAREMFPEKDINHLKIRSKATTLGGKLFDQMERHRKTYGGRLIGTNPENYKHIKNLVNPDDGPMGIGEIEMLKRETMTPDLSPNVTQKLNDHESTPNSAGDDLLSDKNKEGPRESQASDHFSFRPGNLKQNLKENMEEMMENLKNVTPVEKKMAESQVIAQEANDSDEKPEKDNDSTTPKRNFDIHFPERRRSKAQTLQNIRAGEEITPRNKTIMGKLSGELMETGNEGRLSEFDDPNEGQDESYIHSRHQSMSGNRENEPELRNKASTLAAHHFNFKKNSSDSNSGSDHVRPVSFSSHPRKKVKSILSRKGSRRGTMARKRVTFSEMLVLPEENETDPKEEFINKKPEGSVMLTKEQTEKLIQVLEQPIEEGEEIILKLNGDQVLDVVNKNVGEEGVTMAVTGDQWLRMKKERNRVMSVYPKDFFALVEKNKTKGSRLSVYPGEFFEGIEGRRRTIAGDRERAISVYPKDLFELVEKEIQDGKLDVYPQEIFDLLKEFGDEDVNEEIREKAETIYPKDFLDIAEKQAERKRGRANTVYPEGLFDIAEQEKINAKRVSVYPKDLFNLIEKESRNRNVSIYPEDFFKLLDDEYDKIVRLTPDQTETVVKANTGQRSTQIVISPEQRQTLLNQLKEHKEKVEEIKKDLNVRSGDSGMVVNDDFVEPCRIELEPDQVLDIFNQNCAMDGAVIELTPEQWALLEKNNESQRKTVIGKHYYDAVNDELVDDEGARMSLAKLSARDRQSVLSKLSQKRFSVLLDGEEHRPQMVADVYFDVEEDAVIDTRTESKMQIGALKEDERIRLLSSISKANQEPPGTVLEGHAYYDALVDELVDSQGRRHSLKDKNLLDLRDLVEENDCQRISVIVQPDNDTAMLLENVTYLPVEDCLVDAHDRKTKLGDMTPEQRAKLMTALGERRGTLIDVSRIRANTNISNIRERLSTVKINVLEVSDYRMDEDERRYMQELRERQKTDYKSAEDAAEQIRQLEKTDSAEDSESDPNVKISKVDGDDELNPDEEREREKVRSRQKTQNPGGPDKKSYAKEIEELLAGGSPTNRGSVSHRKKNYSALRPKGITVHHKGVPTKKKKKVKDIDSLRESKVSTKSDGKRKNRKRKLTKRYTVTKKKKKGKERRTVLGKLTEDDKARLVEEEYLKNLEESNQSIPSPKSRKSKKSAHEPTVVENLVRGGQSSLAQRLLEESSHLIEKRHTMDHGKNQDLDSEERRIKSQTIMGKEVHGPKRSILTESEDFQSKTDKNSEGTRAQNSEPLEVQEEIKSESKSRKSSHSPKKVRNLYMGDNNDDLKYEENLKRFEKMDKHDIGKKNKGRVTFIEKRNLGKIDDKERRRKTFANKLFMMRKRSSQEPIREEPEYTDYIIHENPDRQNLHSSEVLRHPSSIQIETPQLYQHQSVNPRGTQYGRNSFRDQGRLVRIHEDGRISNLSDEDFKERVKMILDEEKNNWKNEILPELRAAIQANNMSMPQDDTLMEEFYRFCSKRLPKDADYKQTIMFVNLFYFFMEKKKMLG